MNRTCGPPPVRTLLALCQGQMRFLGASHWWSHPFTGPCAQGCPDPCPDLQAILGPCFHHPHEVTFVHPEAQVCRSLPYFPSCGFHRLPPPPVVGNVTTRTGCHYCFLCAPFPHPVRQLSARLHKPLLGTVLCSETHLFSSAFEFCFW